MNKQEEEEQHTFDLIVIGTGTQRLLLHQNAVLQDGVLL